ncbi:F0F1 ATP synthase subunit gamma [Candidatus Erwinia haradaeae]|uniref:ATP synthase gamma chain n=1 Tax=Candidatus Erwinia haradaeae TaxID=1922217 RepID=A0A451DG03_9GAMM|nr:F0F1 ATP synthase subunit gamma [Candidatus Erwinia haradaeae]VFP85561.1 ATP synthase gamma chain [Candidatus Erwinia haradaeae]
MTNEKGIRRKILCINNTQKITKAMEMVSASKLRKSQDRITVSQPYIETLRQVINHMALANLEYKHPYLNQRPVHNIGCLIISTDRGLCGGLNFNLFRKVLKNMQIWSASGININLGIIGYQGILFFNSIKSHVITQIYGIKNQPILSDLIGPVQVMLQAYDEHRINKLYVANNKFINTMSQCPTIKQLLPFVPKNDHSKATILHKWDYLYEPDPKTILDLVLKRYIETQVYQSVIENLASEQAARMLAMKMATDNAGNLITELQLAYNKARQAGITRELTEIVAGASAV